MVGWLCIQTIMHIQTNGCNHTFINIKSLTTHRKRKHGNMELCLCYRNCTAYFRNIDDLVKHKIEIHGYNQLRCGIDGCNYTCKLMVEIQNMMRTCNLTSNMWTSLAGEGFINLNLHYLEILC